jgi:hypothetical protein
MNRNQHHAVRETDSRSMGTAFKLGMRSKRDLRGDKERSFNQKFADFIRAYPTEQEGLDAYNALPSRFG